MKVDQDEVKAYVARKGRKYVIDNVVTRCPTNALSLNDDDTLDVDNKSCVRCMHCLNVMPACLSPGDDKGVSILIGGKRTLKIGDLFGTVVVPFMSLESEQDYERLVEIAEETIDFHRARQLPRRHRPRGRSQHGRPPARELLRAHGRLGRGSRKVVRKERQELGRRGLIQASKFWGHHT
jgi:dissimilatory sulfite reductase (desulfoviridin) alpha/beta subunit